MKFLCKLVTNPLKPTACAHPINLCNSLGSGLSDLHHCVGCGRGPWLESVRNFPFLPVAFSLPTRGFRHRAQHLGAHPGSLDRGRRTLPGQKGRIDNSTGAQENSGGPKTQRVSCPCVCLWLSVFVCVPALSLVSFLLFPGISVNRQTVVGAIDESRPGLHSGGL